MDYETGKRLEAIEQCIIELQMKVFPERFKKDETKK